ncbi:MAG: hypothetical protein BWY14_01180 [Parcubacteria group bacterium ADurb.Bin192]|jgi:hypothetical protein|nr:MAG: hypothetical protein BWY14_01180 [Parcubacteria group bacterium ADurb.Bin192]
MAKFISELTELEIGNIRFNKGVYTTDDPDKIAFLEKIESLRRYRVRRIDRAAPPEVASKDNKKRG